VTHPADRFDPASIAGLDEPVRRYLTHALTDGAPLHSGARLAMTGRIRVGPWLSFTAQQEFSGHAFTWRARAGVGPVRPLHVTDCYGDGAGSTEGRLFGRLRFLHADDENTARAAAGRAAAESVWVPATLLPRNGVCWRAVSDDVIVASFEVPPEQVQLELGIDAAGAVRTLSIMRWGDVGQDRFGYIPFGGRVHAERRFGDVVLPSRVTIGWWFGTPRYAPFFAATILSVEQSDMVV
jgi:hypothetical protein